MTSWMPEPIPEETQGNLAWRSNLRALSDDWGDGEVTDNELFETLLDETTPATAQEALEIIGKKAAERFDLWFTFRFGDRINNLEDRERSTSRKRLIEAYHRLVLDRREPL